MTKWTIETLHRIDPKDFETLLSGLFSKMGYKTELTQYSRDKGVDIVIRIENFGLSHTWLVQAKRYTGPVGVRDVREYSSLRYRDRVDGVIMVTTSSFTKEAIEEAAEHNLKLIDGKLLVEMLNHYLPDVCKEADHDGKTHGKKTYAGREMNDIGNGTILKRGEQVLAREVVMIGCEKSSITLTNRNIFIKKESSGLFTTNSNVDQRIEIKEILGIHCEPNRMILITGKKKLRIYPISSGNISLLRETLETLRPEYLKGEYLTLSSRKGTEIIILTNKRIIITDVTQGIKEEIINTKIIGVELKGGFLKKEMLTITEDTGVMTKHHLDVDVPARWKEMIEEHVRIY
ncbi:MAG: restriction endonuclease [Methanolobus sp.]|nr:restriction endonuclease [Methanolobus sp.]